MPDDPAQCVLLFFAIIIGFVLLIKRLNKWIYDCTGNSESQDRPPENTDPQSNGKEPGRDLASRLDALANAIHAYRQKRDTHENRRARGDKKTLQALAYAAVFAFLAFIAAMGADLISFFQLSEIRNEQRAWVKTDIPVIDSDFSYTAGIGDTIKFHVRLKNVGRTPAYNLIYNIVINVPDLIHSDWHKGCDRLKSSPVNKQIGIVLLPTAAIRSDEIEQGIFFTIGEDIIARIPNGRLSLNIVGCVDYFIDSDSRHHQTGVFYHVYSMTPEGALNPDFSPHERIFKKDFRLEPSVTERTATN